MSSPESDVHTPPEYTRKRVARACEACRMRKTRCNGERPCMKCKAANIVCSNWKTKATKAKVHPAGYYYPFGNHIVLPRLTNCRYAEALERRQAQLVAGLQESYRRLLDAHVWPGKKASVVSGQPCVHDILVALDVLKTEKAEHEPAITQQSPTPEQPAQLPSPPICKESTRPLDAPAINITWTDESQIIHENPEFSIAQQAGKRVLRPKSETTSQTQIVPTSSTERTASPRSEQVPYSIISPDCSTSDSTLSNDVLDQYPLVDPTWTGPGGFGYTLPTVDEESFGKTLQSPFEFNPSLLPDCNSFPFYDNMTYDDGARLPATTTTAPWWASDPIMEDFASKDMLSNSDIISDMLNQELCSDSPMMDTFRQDRGYLEETV